MSDLTENLSHTRFICNFVLKLCNRTNSSFKPDNLIPYLCAGSLNVNFGRIAIGCADSWWFLDLFLDIVYKNSREYPVYNGTLCIQVEPQIRIALFFILRTHKTTTLQLNGMFPSERHIFMLPTLAQKTFLQDFVIKKKAFFWSILHWWPKDLGFIRRKGIVSFIIFLNSYVHLWKHSLLQLVNN